MLECRLEWTRVDWGGKWTGWDQNGLEFTEVEWTGMDWSGLELVEVDWGGLDCMLGYYIHVYSKFVFIISQS